MPHRLQCLGLGRPYCLVTRAALAALLLAACAPLAVADDFSDFRVPTHRVSSLTLNVVGRFVHTHEDQSAQTLSSMVGEGSGSWNGAWLWDSDRWRTSISTSGYVDGRAQHLENRSSVPGSADRHDQAQRMRNVYEDARVDLGLRHYPWAAPLGWTLGLTAENRTSQRWTHSGATDVVTDSSGTHITTDVRGQGIWGYDRVVIGTAALGAGRVRDVSATYEARVMEQRLLAARVLRRPLSREARQRLAALLYAQSDYAAAHDKPAKFLWRDIEAILRDDGALAGDAMGAYGTLRAGEPLAPTVWPGASERVSEGTGPLGFTRAQGWFVGAGLSGNHEQAGDHARFTRTLAATGYPTFVDAFGSSGTLLAQSDLSWGPEAEWHRPLGLDWQVDAAASASMPIHPHGHQIATTAIGEIRYLITDRWLAHAAGDVHWDRDRSSTVSFESIQEAEITYAIEDHLSLGLLAQAQQRRDHIPSTPSQADPRYRSEAVYLTIGYRLLGAADIPGITPPIRPGLNP